MLVVQYETFRKSQFTSPVKKKQNHKIKKQAQVECTIMPEMEEMKVVLKSMPYRICSASAKVRLQILEDLQPILSSDDLIEPAIRLICRALVSTLPRYRDSVSRQSAQRTAANLLSLHSEHAVKHMTIELHALVSACNSESTPKSMRSLWEQCFCWSCMILDSSGSEQMKAGAESLIELQSLLFAGVVASQHERTIQTTSRRFWQSLDRGVDLKIYTNYLSRSDSSVMNLSLTSLILQYPSLSEKQDLLTDIQSKAVTALVRLSLTGRVPGAGPLLRFCCGAVLARVDHAVWAETVVPAVCRGLLRSPDQVLPSIVLLVAEVPLDLGRYVKQLAPPLISQLACKQDTVRSSAGQTLSLLGQHCSDTDAIISLADMLLATLDGRQSKLSLTEQRQSVLTVVGSLSSCAITGTSIQQTATTVCDQLIAVLGAEQHEPTLLLGLRQLQLWCGRLGQLVSSNLTGWFQALLTRKNGSPPLRVGCMMCMEAVMKGSAAQSISDVAAALHDILGRVAKNVTQVPVLSEGVLASILLLRLSNFTESHLDAVFKSTINKHYLFTDKFSTGVAPEVVPSLCRLCDLLLSSYRERLGSATLPAVVRCLVILLSRADCYRGSSGQLLVASVRRVLLSETDVELAVCFVEQLTQFISGVSVQSSGESRESSDSVLSSHSLHLALQSIVSGVSSDCANKQSLCFSLLVVCHHQSLQADYFGLWEKLVQRLGITPKEFVEAMRTQLLETFCDGNVLPKSSQSVVSTLSRVAGDIMVEPIIDRVSSLLTNDALLAITFEEYSIFVTPEGVLYKQSVKDSLSSSSTANIKRESKLYSYQQQMELLEEQRLLHKKLLAEGRELEVLTPKQREAVNKQLAKESAVRARLSELQVQLERGVSLVEAIAEGNSECLEHHYDRLLSCILPSLSSPLASSCTAELFRRLAINTLQKSLPLSLVESAVTASLSLLSPYFEPSADWTADIKSAEFRHRLILQLHALCVARGALSAPAFSTLFYLVKAVLESGCKDSAAIEAALKFVGCHVNMRGDGDLYDPSLLPLHDMLVLMLRIIGSSEEQTRRLSVTVLLQLATACSGEEGCAVATTQHVTTLADALYSPAPAVKLASLKCLSILADVIPGLDDSSLVDLLTSRLLLAKFDPDSTVREEAAGVWQALSLHESSSSVTQLLSDCVHSQPSVQQAAGGAVGSLLEAGLAPADDVIKQLLSLYTDNFKMSEPVLDEFERVLVEPMDLWHARAGVGQALKTVGPLCPQTSIIGLMQFFVSHGLNDRAAEVRSAMLTASLACIDTHGKENVCELLPLFDDFLETTPSTKEYDSVRQSVVILMGSLAKHMDKTDSKIKPIFTKLLQMLSTPSEQVQESASSCLPALVAAVKADVPDITRSLLTTLLSSDKFSERRGAAYGIAGLVKGSGILSLKQLDIMSTLIEAIQDKKDFKKREGSLFAFTMLCNKLGRLFEPYIVHILPHLLLCYGDQNTFVRDATHETARAVMSNLSTHGVKLVLPALLAALQEDSWRTKAGSVDLLGSMAYCAPKQLSSCLPNIVPQLITVLGDSHQRVQKAGAHALKQIGSVIRNPEVQTIVPDLLAALRDPTDKTSSALNVLIDTKFIHFIDAPSLALIMPVVQRAFQDRSTEVRKMAAQIIGKMYSLTDQKDLTPYLPAIIPGLKSSLLDPVPEVRSKSARALGAMVRGMGETSFDSLMPWLMQTLISEQNSVDRSGAAQGLSEVIGGLGVEKLHNIMPDIISTASRSDIAPHVRDGYIMLFIYLPMVFQDDFTRYIGDIIPPILKALADETEYVRDTALRAGQRVVNTYADSAVQLLLPELEAGLFNENWRIRLSSIQLLGDLLYRISGVSGKMTTETAGDDDNFGTEKSHQSIVRLLGTERRNRVLSGLYMGRSDVSLMVRQISLHVWKVVVSNTPSTLREILPTLLSLLLGHLASESHDKRQVAAATLGDLVRKLGERVLVEILPILEQGLDSERSDERQGVCIGLGEIMASTSKDVVLYYVDNLVPTVRRALVDPLSEVRSAAAKTFDSLHSTIGTRALDDILPDLMEKLTDADAQTSACALDGLRQLIVVKPRAVLPHLLPRLVAPPVNTHALSVLAGVAGDALTRHLVRVLPALLSVCSTKQDECLSVLLAVNDPAAVRTVVDTLLSKCSGAEEPMEQRRAVTALLAAYCRETSAELEQHEVQLMTAFIQMFVVEDEQLLLNAWVGLEAVLKRVQITAENNYISQLRQAFRFAQAELSPGQLLPGMCLSRGITPLLPVFREAVLNGAPELKESAAAGLRELVRLSSVPALRTSVIHITGPLIRVLGDRFSASVKVAVLQCLALLLEKVGILLRPFLPQLQTTFVKALSDAHRQVRLHAAASLGHLMPIHSRVDALFSELITMVKTGNDELNIRETTLQALRNLCRCGGLEKLSPAVTEQLASSLLQLITPVTEESARMAAAGCLGQLLSCTLPEELCHSLLNTLLQESKSGEDWSGKHYRTAALYVALMSGADKLLTDQWQAKIESTITSCLKSDRAPLVANGARATAYILCHQLKTDTTISRELLLLIIEAFTNSNSNDVRQVIVEAIDVVSRCCGTDKPLPRPISLSLLPVLMTGVREKNAGLRSSSESALVSLLCLSAGNEFVQKLLEDVNATLRDSVEDFLAKVTRKIDTFSSSAPPRLDETEVC